jgi:hypothetical protein
VEISHNVAIQGFLREGRSEVVSNGRTGDEVVLRESGKFTAQKTMDTACSRLPLHQSEMIAIPKRFAGMSDRGSEKT